MNYQFLGKFPETRLRRNRQNQEIRSLVAETSITANDLILPLFVCEGTQIKEEISTIPDVFRYSIDNLLKIIEEACNLGIKAIMLFPVIDDALKDNQATESSNSNNLICRTIKAIKSQFKNILIICDVALDPYTASGHDGIIDENGNILNDETIHYLEKQALTCAKAGCDMVAPSDMMDGRITAIRKFLDNNNFQNVGIISYSAKYASNFYGPFRDAVGSSNNLKQGNKKTYQMDFHNSGEALREIAFDIEEGADAIIIKPAMPYLDIIANSRRSFPIPIFAYQVSGEFAMLKFAEKHNILNFINSYYESLIAIKRAGANAIITYGAIEICQFLKNNPQTT